MQTTHKRYMSIFFLDKRTPVTLRSLYTEYSCFIEISAFPAVSVCFCEVGLLRECAL